MYMYMLFLKLNAHYSSAVKLHKGVIFQNLSTWLRVAQKEHLPET